MPPFALWRSKPFTVLRSRGALYIVPQNLFELWVVATRPNERNGLGMPPSLAATELLRMKKMLHFLPDTKDIYSIWEELVITNGVCGKPAHDARLVAAAMAHGLRGILTFDKTGFSRFPTISAVHPTET